MILPMPTLVGKGKTYIDDLVLYAKSLPSSEGEIKLKTESLARCFIEMYCGFKLEDLKFKISEVKSNYETYRRRVEIAVGVMNSAEILSKLHSNFEARKFFFDVGRIIQNILFRKVHKGDDLHDIVKFIDPVNPRYLVHDDEILNKVKTFLKLFHFYNLKLDRNTDTYKFYEHNEDADFALDEVYIVRDIGKRELIEKLEKANDESKRKKLWIELSEVLEYSNYMTIAKDHNKRSIQGLKYSDYFDYLLDKNVLQGRDEFMKEIDQLIEAITPQYNALIRRLLTMYAANGEEGTALSRYETPVIKAWDFDYLFYNFKNSDDFKLAKLVPNASFTLSKAIDACLEIFRLSTGYDVSVDNTKDHFGWASNVVKYKVTLKGDVKPQMYLYLDVYVRDEILDDEFEYIRSDISSDGTPCAAMSIPIVFEEEGDEEYNYEGCFESIEVCFYKLRWMFELFGKAAYYAVFQPTFLPSHQTPDTRTLENENFKIEFFKHMFTSMMYESNILQEIVWPGYELAKIDYGSENDKFAQTENELVSFHRYQHIKECMQTLVGWKFAERMYSVVKNNESPKDSLCKLYNNLYKMYLQLYYDSCNNIPLFTENTDLFYPENYATTSDRIKKTLTPVVSDIYWKGHLVPR
ncbi:hypothetical protein H4219_004367 [Mycoemilia scoparia]|uniref:Uncharacterized protein n=1 Tax=Mycoemilia scoparia TaxID=417184 RepID=A0A9W8A014_9FUNG|nr:hypothetical protein H4219_004367 [Mycoemilia scoparia]